MPMAQLRPPFQPRRCRHRRCRHVLADRSSECAASAHGAAPPHRHLQQVRHAPLLLPLRGRLLGEGGLVGWPLFGVDLQLSMPRNSLDYPRGTGHQWLHSAGASAAVRTRLRSFPSALRLQPLMESACCAAAATNACLVRCCSSCRRMCAPPTLAARPWRRAGI